MTVELEISCSLPLQMLMYCSFWYYPIYAIGMGLCVSTKVISLVKVKISYFNCSLFHTVIMSFMYAMWLFIECIRIRSGFSGNLRERVSELSGLLIFSLFPQSIIALYFICLQPFTGSGFAFPIEISLNVVYLILLIPEIIFGWISVRRVINHQTALFFLRMKDESSLDHTKVKGLERKSWLSWNSLESFW